mgnify:CR=1 FL=1
MFDQANYNDSQEFPCDCGGNIAICDRHIIAGSLGDPPEICCDIWSCDKCGKEYKRCENQRS